MSNINNEIIMENLWEEGLEIAYKRGYLHKYAEAFAENYAREKFENMQ